MIQCYTLNEQKNIKILRASLLVRRLFAAKNSMVVGVDK
ncbi:hypothetical protein Cst_c20440 [Thermoclostridium stercorarium subsp. stercorarium DSM 8532]|uniref:Uncharacterized protein n=1 Tax=Thermoclostridium stercorarium (strain ATCC 35414 / DSM 8532 / NCIMB 11754) TaxID=1121335 RepID=L7VQD4_THES1|nr:hypothetical protein Cst_c20440 [Thermoclostridium stercorarium subsp. stercorarium DSM 8532]